MLGRYPVYAVLLSTDLDETREFYQEKLGLEIIRDDETAIVFRSGDTELSVTLSSTGTADSQTQAGWRVDDLVSEIVELRSRGVVIQDYDMPDLKTVDGIADIGFALIAWIVDPHGNALGILQPKG